MKNSCSSRVFLPILLILALALSACQFSSSAPSKAPAPKPATPTGPHIALALPSGGPYAGVSAKIRNGAEIALRELQAGGLLAQLHMVDTSEPDWNAQLAALPPNCVMVGGPLQAPVFKQLQTSGMLEKRVFFAFMPSLLPGDEGVQAWRFFPSPQDQIDRLVSFVTEDLGLRTFGAFYPTDNYGPRMTGLLDQKLTGMGITLHSASYTPGQSSTWSGQAATLINPTTQENITAPIPQTQFEALFLPDSWKNMNLLTTSLMYNGEDRLVLLGTTLWEQGLDGKTVAEPDRYALAVFPAAWDATQAPAALRAPGTDFWVALGYDFVRFAVRMAFDSRPPAATVNAQAANMKIQWAMAPLSWDEKGIAHQKLHLFQPAACRPAHAGAAHRGRAGQLPHPGPARHVGRPCRAQHARGHVPDARCGAPVHHAPAVVQTAPFAGHHRHNPYRPITVHLKVDPMSENKNISQDVVAHMAQLSRLAVSDEEKALFARQFGDILAYMDVLAQVDTSAVEPLYSPVSHATPMRDDQPERKRRREDVLGNAPEHDEDYFIVPRIV